MNTMLVKGGWVQLIIVLLILAFKNCQAQVTKNVQGVEIESDTSTRINQLPEVTIKGQSIKAAMKDLEDSYKDKGIFFKGKPPIYLLSPFGGSPVTFFYELFSKDSKRARKLQKYARAEIEYAEVSTRFNDDIIKSVLPGVTEIELEHFKAAYLPKAEQIAGWSDYDLLSYIKRSFDEFKKNQSAKE